MITVSRLRIETQGRCDIIDLTPRVAEEVSNSTLGSGTATIFVSGSTAGITTIEYEPGLVNDLKQAWERLIPEEITYQHNERWGDDNGHSHVRASMLGPSLVIPFEGNVLTLGTWQQIVLVDFDVRPRSREIVV
ncbi:MAG: secondary thiamine-phosphate synthase enzyme YjbQ, partial [Dehalococcoidia bacterium]